jgi:hypothetical protein
MPKIKMRNHELVVDGTDLSGVVAAGSPRLTVDRDGNARLVVELIGRDLDVDLDGVVTVEQAEPTRDERVVVLTKPGDTLLVGNVSGVTDMTVDQVKQVTDALAALGLKVIFFADDIDIAKLPADV